MVDDVGDGRGVDVDVDGRGVDVDGRGVDVDGRGVEVSCFVGAEVGLGFVMLIEGVLSLIGRNVYNTTNPMQAARTTRPAPASQNIHRGLGRSGGSNGGG